jgi:hypothetical protein
MGSAISIGGAWSQPRDHIEEGIVSLNDGGREIVARAGDKGNLPGLGRTRLARELLAAAFDPDSLCK